MATDNPREEKYFSTAYTRVIWDFASHPMPDNVSSFLIYKDIEAALDRMGYHGRFSIWAYGGEKLDEDMAEEFKAAPIIYLPQGDDDKMVQEILSCAAIYSDEPTNLVVISKRRTEDNELDMVLLCLTARDYNVILVNPDEDNTEKPFLFAEK